MKNVQTFGNFIYPTENSVLLFMRKNKIQKARMYKTAYVNSSGYQDNGFSAENLNTDYYKNQKVITNKTKTFLLIKKYNNK